MKFRIVQTLLTGGVFVLMILSSCNEDDPEGSSGISKGLHITQGTKIEGQFPTPSEDSSAPVLDQATDTIYIIYATYKNVIVAPEAGEAQGFNVKIEGVSGYFNVPSTHAFMNSSDLVSLGFSILVEDYVKPGTFKIAYSIYDAENRVSNIVERTIIITERGGPNSEFLSEKVWSTVKEIRGTGETSDTTVAGESRTFEYSETLDCYGQPDKVVNVVNENRLDYHRYTFMADGKLTIELASYTKTFHPLESRNSCSLQYTENTLISNFEGTWSYHSASNRLILIYSRFAFDENGVKTVYDDKMYEYDVTQNEGTITWKSAGQRVPLTVTLN